MNRQPSVLEALDRHARDLADEPAVVCASGVTTYRELHRITERFTTAMVQAGLGAGRILAPGRVLAVTLDDGVAAVAALLAALRTGTASVWLEPDLPAARRAAIMADCSPAGVMVGDGTTTAPPTDTCAQLRYTTDAAVVVERARSEPVPAVVPSGTACVVYTSGSTGTPKGIVQLTSNLDQITSWLAAEVGLRPGARMLQWARMSYDAAYVEVFAAIHAGATLVIPPPKVKADVAAVADWIDDHRVTHLQLVPTLCRALVQTRAEFGTAPADRVRVLSLFGEQLLPGLLAEAGRHFPAAEIYNFYGPTECTLATFHRITHVIEGEPVPIGRPIPGRQLLLCDDTGAAVPDGEIGEILVRSRFLAHGYLNQPEATAQAFIPDSRGEPGSRLYRTGDRARRLPDGSLVFAGRLDHQVKIRGARVELGEIEAVLMRHDDVRDGAVVVRTDDEGQNRVVAYLTGRDGRPLDILAVHRFLVATLPSYMIPAGYVVLDELPRISNGKLDRQRLPDPGSDREHDSYSPPLTETEQRLSLLWSELLHVDRIGRADDFFALGGQSLLAPRLVAAVASTFNIDLPVISIFEHPTLEAFAAQIDACMLPAAG